jgi:hypothetical protein
MTSQGYCRGATVRGRRWMDVDGRGGVGVQGVSTPHQLQRIHAMVMQFRAGILELVSEYTQTEQQANKDTWTVGCRGYLENRCYFAGKHQICVGGLPTQSRVLGVRGTVQRSCNLRRVLCTISPRNQPFHQRPCRVCDVRGREPKCEHKRRAPIRTSTNKAPRTQQQLSPSHRISATYSGLSSTL